MCASWPAASPSSWAGPALVALAEQAATLAKADLLTDMVGEFPELQGTMGAYYARHDGLPEAVAEAIEDHYKPRFAGDVLPRGEAGLVVALADKLETLAGLFGIGQLPTGDKDPFALRRHALGVIRMLIERDLPLAVPALVAQAFAVFPAGHGQAQAELQHFLYDRLVGSLREQGYSAQEVDAVVALRPAALGRHPQAPGGGACLCRAARGAVAGRGQQARRQHPAQVRRGAGHAAGRRAVCASRPKPRWPPRCRPPRRAPMRPLPRGDYAASLQALAALKAPVDAFFDAVMVNADDPALRRNRLALLKALHDAMNRVADLSRLAS